MNETGASAPVVVFGYRWSMYDDVAAPPPKRPGGLTALGILNIIFALVGMLGGLAMSSMNKDLDMNEDQYAAMDREFDRIADDPSTEGNPEFNRAIMKGMTAQMRSSSPTAYRVMFVTGGLGGVLLLLSGFGLLGQRRVLGRHGSMAAAAALTVCGIVAVWKLSFMFWGFPMLGAGYAIVLACLVHFAYRPALQR